MNQGAARTGDAARRYFLTFASPKVYEWCRRLLCPWTYIPVVSADTSVHPVTFPIFHFSEYYVEAAALVPLVVLCQSKVRFSAGVGCRKLTADMALPSQGIRRTRAGVLQCLT